MRTLFGNTCAMLFLAIVLALSGLLLGFLLRNFIWFARFGALVVSVGITLLSRASIIREDIIAHVQQVETGLSHVDPAHYEQMGVPAPEWVLVDKRTRAAVGVWGPAVSFVGTVIWGFGDLLNRYWSG
ncbi:hypothetical protein HNQ50_002487 [Silvimonas terrae]|uniref:Uncharacterized protein n=1 Tax=Silvimonas terrae TaxID=300266 RepID=A0A840RFF2_9NEIS|nr:hypothetical protein [Silvimonas terrae]MBB5191757.1 hypothetical protein [Silvimonas terrae]